MAAVRDHLISGSHKLTHSITGTVRALHKIDGENWCSCCGNLHLSLNELATFAIYFSMEFEQYDEERYNAYLRWDVTRAPPSYPNEETDSGRVWVGLYYYWTPEHPDSVVFDESFPISLSIEGDFEYHCQ